MILFVRNVRLSLKKCLSFFEVGFNELLHPFFCRIRITITASFCVINLCLIPWPHVTSYKIKHDRRKYLRFDVKTLSGIFTWWFFSRKLFDCEVLIFGPFEKRYCNIESSSLQFVFFIAIIILCNFSQTSVFIFLTKNPQLSKPLATNFKNPKSSAFGFPSCFILVCFFWKNTKYSCFSIYPMVLEIFRWYLESLSERLKSKIRFFIKL